MISNDLVGLFLNIAQPSQLLVNRFKESSSFDRRGMGQEHPPQDKDASLNHGQRGSEFVGEMVESLTFDFVQPLELLSGACSMERKCRLTAMVKKIESHKEANHKI